MIGRFENFPLKVHGTAKICSIFASHTRIYSFILGALSNLNCVKETNILKLFDEERGFPTVISFEVGLADGIFFNYLDQDTLASELCRLSNSSTLDILDFLIIVKYHRAKGGRAIPLRFDHFLLRFSLSAKTLDLSIFHIQGSRRIQIRDLLEYVVIMINKNLKKKGFKPLTIEKIDAL